MLDQLAVHVHDVECSIGTGGQVDWTKGRIGRGQEFSALLGSPGDEGHAGRFENPTVHQVRQRLAHKGIPMVCRGEQIAAFDDRAATGVEVRDRFTVKSGLAGLMPKMRRRRQGSRIDATDEVSAR